jgi:hypothetical protein
MIKNDSSIKKPFSSEPERFFCCYNLRNRVFFLDDVKFVRQKNKW